MLKYISQRIGFALLTLIVIIVIVFLSVAIFAENPFAKQAEQLNPNNVQQAAQARKLFDDSVRYHLTPNVDYEQFKTTWYNLSVNPFVRLYYWFEDVFNPSTPFGVPFDEKLLASNNVTTIPQYFFRFLKFSVIITVPAFVISTILGIALGVIAGYKRGTIFDVFINSFSLFFVALPSFIIAPIFISILLRFGIAPLFLNPEDTLQVQTNGWGRVILSWMPPILIIVLGSLSGYITFTRNQIVTVLTSNYVLIAKSKGLSKKEIFFKYVLRNISIPLSAIIIPSYIGLLSGGIIIETYWQVPGTSRVLAQSFPQGEINLIMFSTVFFTTLSLFTTILVDVVYTFLDPRIKYGSAAKYSISKLLSAYWNRKKAFKSMIEKKEN